MAAQHFINWVERQGEQLRAKCALKAFDPLNPFALAEKMMVPVVRPAEVVGASEADVRHLLEIDPNAWDAATICLPDKRHIILMNPTRTIKRQHASMMEELSHIHLDHKPRKLVDLGGIYIREWKQADETQAYWVGAAALVPRRVMKGSITLRRSLPAVALQYGVSEELVAFRERILGLRLERMPAA